jgi:hypothetical protein
MKTEQRPETVSDIARLSLFQRELLAEMIPGLWYDCYENQGSGGATLPEWFRRDQKQPLATLRPMLELRALKSRFVDGWPQVCKPPAS